MLKITTVKSPSNPNRPKGLNIIMVGTLSSFKLHFKPPPNIDLFDQAEGRYQTIYY
jgi:hypothetical protein